jgi:hypothetical protein
MSLAAGVITQTNVTDTSASFTATEATGGTGPYTHQWYRDTVSGFTPGPGNILSGKTDLTLDDSGLLPNTTYYYKLRYTDAVSATDDASITTLTAPQTLDPNQFALSEVVGALDQAYNYNTKTVIIDDAQGTTKLFPGMPVKQVIPSGHVSGDRSVPHVVGITSKDDVIFGYINRNMKDQFFLPGQRVEISQGGNVMYLFSLDEVSSGPLPVKVVADLATGGGFKVATGSTGATIIGKSYDIPGAGKLTRVEFDLPSDEVDS